MKKLFSIILFLNFALFINAQHNISVRIPKLPNSDLYLGYHFGIKTFIIDTIKTDKKGNGVFTGENKLHGGIYFIAFPSMDYFDFLVNDDQNFIIIADTTDFINTLHFENSLENQIFIDYQKESALTRAKLDDLNLKKEKFKNNMDSLTSIQSQIDKVSNDFMFYKAQVSVDNKSTLFTKLIFSMSEPLIPNTDVTKLKDFELNPDSVVQQFMYQHYKNHFFDNFDFSDTRLLYTSILPMRISTFLNSVVPPFNDSIKVEIAKLISKAYSNDEVYQYTIKYLLSLFETSGKMANDQLFVFIADNYILNKDVSWLSQDFINQLSLRVKSIKPNMAGKTAPNLELFDINEQPFSLNDISSDYILLYFWDTDCEHCKIMTPIVHAIVKKYENLVQFIAIYTQTNKGDWLEFIETEQLHDWINVYDPTRESNMLDLYDIYKTPRVYLLNKEKTIITKDIEPEELEDYLDVMFKR